MAQIEPSQPPPPTLEYGHGSRHAWIGRHKKKLVLLAICIAIAMPIYWYWASLKHRALWLYWSHKAAAFQMPSAAVDARIYDPEHVAVLPANTADYVQVASGPAGDASYPAWLLYTPTVYQKLSQFDGRLAMIGAPGDPLVFMGTLKRPDGAARLVIITDSGGAIGQLLSGLRVLVVPPPGIFDPMPPAGLSRVWLTGGGNFRVEMRTAVTDQQDPSHIIIEFNVRGKPDAPSPGSGQAFGSIDAYLQNDDSLTFSLRSSWDPQVGLEPRIPGDEKTLTKLSKATGASRIRSVSLDNVSRPRNASGR